MTKNQTKTPIYITNFYSYIDTLIELYCNWPEVSGNAGHAGSPANFLAVRLGLTSTDGPFPYDRHIWSSTVYSSERKCDKNYINELKKWKKRARALPKNTKLYTPRLEVKINQEDIKDFNDIARSTKRKYLELPKDGYYALLGEYSFEDNAVYENIKTQIRTNLKTLDRIALTLGLVDATWYLFKKLNVYASANEDYEKIGIDPDCDKFPSDYYNMSSSTFTNKLSELIYRVNELNPQTLKTLANNQTKHSLDFRSVHWFGKDYSFTASQAACVKILWNALQNDTPDVGGETLLEQSGSEGSRVRDIFKNHPVWNKMIVSGGSKGTFRLADTSN